MLITAVGNSTWLEVKYTPVALYRAMPRFSPWLPAAGNCETVAAKSTVPEEPARNAVSTIPKKFDAEALGIGALEFEKLPRFFRVRLPVAEDDSSSTPFGPLTYNGN